MGDKTGISWADATWNMIRARNRATGKVGWHCEHVTEACRNCYAETQNARRGDSGGTGLEYKPGCLPQVEIFLAEKALYMPLHWRAPRRIFPCSMTDLFGRFVSDEIIFKVLAVMSLSLRHTYQVLTKRPERMRALLNEPATPARVMAHRYEIAKATGIRPDGMNNPMMMQWPLPNLIIGTSLSGNDDARLFMPELVATQAVCRFVSAEPLLGPLDLCEWLAVDRITLQGRPHLTERTGAVSQVGWVIAGGESGANARPCHPVWLRDLRDQCAAAGVPFHFKQHGEWLHETQPTGHLLNYPGGKPLHPFADETCSVRVGVRQAGRLLDGVEHNGFPALAQPGALL